MNYIEKVKGFLATHKNKTLAIVAGVLVPATLFASSYVSPSGDVASTVIRCEVAGACNIVVSTPDATMAAPAEGKFGASNGNAWEITRWISGNFTDDLDVDGDLNVDGNLTGDAYVSSTNVVRSVFDDYSSVATSQTLCAIQNTGSVDRILTGVTLGYATDTTTGGAAQWFTISLSATQGATGTGSSLLFDSNGVAVPTNGLMNFTTTSTFSTAATETIVWRKNVYLNFLIGSPTTTLQGNCRASYY